MFNLKNKKSKKICHVGAWGGNFGDSILQQSIKDSLLSVAPYKIQFEYLNCQKTEFTAELIDDINSRCNLLLVGGGGLVFYRPQDNSKSGWQWNIDIDLIDRIKIPLVVYGIGYNQFEYDKSDFLPVTDEHLKRTVEKAVIFSVRNSGTKRELVKRGCNGDKIEVIPDSGMFIKSKKIKIPGVQKNKVKIGFNWTMDRQDQTFPEPFPESMDMFFKDCMEVLNYAIRNKNAQIFHIGHMNAIFDSGIIAKMKRALIHEPVIIDEVLSEIYPPVAERAGYLADVYRQMDVVIGMRGHANIVSFGQNTPFAGIGSHGKIRYFLEDIGRSRYFFDVRPGTRTSVYDMKRILDDLIDNNSIHRKKIKTEYDIQRKIFNDINKRITDLLR